MAENYLCVRGLKGGAEAGINYSGETIFHYTVFFSYPIREAGTWAFHHQLYKPCQIYSLSCLKLFRLRD